MKITLENVGGLIKAAEDFLAAHPQGELLRDSVLGMGAGDETVCLLTPDELLDNQTACGGGKPCFDEKVVEFLKSQGVQQVLVGVIDWEGWTVTDLQTKDCGEPNLVIAGGAVPIPFKGAMVSDYQKWFTKKELDDIQEYDEEDITPSFVLSQMIGYRNGSWREDSCIEGWSSYESE